MEASPSNEQFLSRPWGKSISGSPSTLSASTERSGGIPWATYGSNDSAVEELDSERGPTVPEAAFDQARPSIHHRILRRLAGISVTSDKSSQVSGGGGMFESFVRTHVRDDAEARLGGTQGSNAADGLTIDEKASKAQAETGYIHPLGDFANLHEWGSESQVSRTRLIIEY